MDTLPDSVGSSQMDGEASRASGTPEAAAAMAKSRSKAPVRVEGMSISPWGCLRMEVLAPRQR